MTLLRRKSFDFRWIIASLTGVSATGAYVNILTPSHVGLVGGFIAVVACTVFCCVAFLTNNIVRAGLYTVTLGVFLLLRFFGLRDWYLTALLVITALALDAYIARNGATHPV